MCLVIRPSISERAPTEANCLMASSLYSARSALARASAGLAGAQPLQQRTGATHGAAWCAPDGAIVMAREDVGRHNALDKLIGALVGTGMFGGDVHARAYADLQRAGISPQLGRVGLDAWALDLGPIKFQLLPSYKLY